MATHGKDDAVEGSWSPKRPRTAVQQRAAAPTAKDPEVLAADIERTREELAQTLDAIADKVSPKRVARRTSKRLGESVKEGAGRAEEALKTGAAAAVETVRDAAETVKEKVAPSADPVTTTGLHEPVVVVSSSNSPIVAAPDPRSQDTVAVSSAGALADATPAPFVAPAGAELPNYRPYTPPPASRLPVYACAAAALAVVLLVLRRRRR